MLFLSRTAILLSRPKFRGARPQMFAFVSLWRYLIYRLYLYIDRNVQQALKFEDSPAQFARSLLKAAGLEANNSTQSAQHACTFDEISDRPQSSVAGRQCDALFADVNFAVTFDCYVAELSPVLQEFGFNEVNYVHIIEFLSWCEELFVGRCFSSHIFPVRL
jgi:hypothetical protein